MPSLQHCAWLRRVYGIATLWRLLQRLIFEGDVCVADTTNMEWVGTEPVNATRASDDVMADYGYHPYPDNR